MINKTLKTILSGLAVFMFLFIFVNYVRAGDNIWTTNGPYGVRLAALAVHPGNNNILLASFLEGANVLKAIDGGVTWQDKTGGLQPGNVSMKFAFDPNNPRNIFFASGCGLYRSVDEGENWEQIGFIEFEGQIFPIQASAVAISPLDSTIFVGGNDGTCFTDPLGSRSIYKSTDGGESWEQISLPVIYPSKFHFSEIVIAPSAPHIIYASSPQFEGVLKSIDGGNTWEYAIGGFLIIPDIRALTVDPYDSQVVYMGTSHQGLYKTTNGGAQWFAIGSGLQSSHISSIVIDPGNQQVIYVGGGDNPGTGIPGVYRSLDNTGLSFTPFMDGMGSRAIYSMVVDKNNPLNIYAGTQSGVWKYTLISGPADYSVSINNGALFTNQTSVMLTLTAPSGTDEMIISNDGGFVGATWEPFSTQKPWTIIDYGSYVLPRIVYVKFKIDGKISGLYQDDIILDVAAPTGTVEIADTYSDIAKSINSPPEIITGAPSDTLTNSIFLPYVTKNSRPGYLLVGLLLSATDDLSGVSEVMISNDLDFTDAKWQPFTTDTEWWIADIEIPTVYVKFRDRAGNESIVYSDALTP